MILPHRLIDQLETRLGAYADRGQGAGAIHACLGGYGCVARPLSRFLEKFGTRNFTVVDKKQYKLESVASQCVAAEVGRAKVDVAAELLGASSNVTTFQSDISEVPAGIIRPDSIVIATFDNRFADAIANALAIAMRSILIKVNIEPLQQAIAIRSYDFRAPAAKCVVCAFRDSDRLLQQHPRSCESFAAERPTNGPKLLARAAGELGSWVACRAAVGIESIFGKELLVHLDQQRLIESELPARQPCVVDHQAGRPNLTYLRCGPGDVKLREILPHRSHGDVQVQFCHEVSTRSCCVDCRRECNAVHWIARATQTIDSCTACGGRLVPIPFWSFSTVSARRLESVLDRPMCAWGVPDFAVLRVIANNVDRSFVLDATHNTSQEGVS